MATTLWFEDSPQQPSPLATVAAPEQEGIIGDLGGILADIGSVLTVDELEAIAPPGWDPEYFSVDWANHILADEW